MPIPQQFGQHRVEILHLQLPKFNNVLLPLPGGFVTNLHNTMCNLLLSTSTFYDGWMNNKKVKNTANISAT